MYVAAIKASLACATLAAHHYDTVVEASVAGSAGNSFRFALVGDSLSGESVTYSGSTLTAHFKTDVSTVALVDAAITAFAGAIRVKTAGTPGTVLVNATDSFAAVALSGGADGYLSPPQTCTLTGWLFNLNGEAIDGAVVRITVQAPAVVDRQYSVRQFPSWDVTTDGNGKFEFGAIRGIQIEAYIEAVGYRGVFTVPNAATADFFAVAPTA